MLVVRAAQIDALAAEAERQNVAALCGWIRERRPHLRARVDDPQLEREAAEALRICRRHAITTVESAGIMLELLIRLGRGFDEHPKIARVLADVTASPDERAGRLMAIKTPAEWERVALGDTRE